MDNLILTKPKIESFVKQTGEVLSVESS